MENRTCCVTGHREIPLDRRDWVRERMEEEIEAALREGYNHFISGFARGWILSLLRQWLREKNISRN